MVSRSDIRNSVREKMKQSTAVAASPPRASGRQMCYRLCTHEASTGAMNLFNFAPGTFDDESEAIGAMLATRAAIALMTA